MTGLDKILDQIKKESDAASAAKIADANTKAADIKSRAELEAREECNQIELRGKQQSDDILARASSAAALYKKKTVLAEKQRIIAEVFDKAEERLCNLPDREYFDVIIRIASKNALSQDGQIVLSEKDKKRLPVDFEAALNSALKAGKLKVSDDTCETDGGFILSYGGIEENCTFSALIDAERESIADKVQDILFQ